MNLYSRAVNKIIKVVSYFEALLLFVSVVVVTMQVFTRYVLNDPLSWTEQTGRWLFVWMMMLGLSIMFNSNITMAFDLILDHLPSKANIALSLFFRIFTIAFCAFWCYSGILYVIEHGARIASGLGLPLGCVYSAQPVGAALIILVMIKQIIEIVQSMRNKKEVVSE